MAGLLDRSLLLPLPTGQIRTPLKNAFSGMSRPRNANPDMFVGIDGWVQNNSRPGVGDGHSTMTTGRSEATGLGTTSAVAFNWRYDKPADLPQVGRNLFFQTQMKGSPIDAISTDKGAVDFVWRNPTTIHRDELGPIPWGRVMFFVIVQKLAKSGGFVECWYEVDDWPNLDGSPEFRHANINTWQGANSHHTLGQYRTPTKGGLYRGYFNRFGRAATAERAIQLARG